MAKKEKVKAVVPLEEVVLAQAFEFEALLNILERRGVIQRAEVLDEIKRLKAQVPKAGSPAREV
jgi:hypothetical protein